jgi:hypothetical protein
MIAMPMPPDWTTGRRALHVVGRAEGRAEVLGRIVEAVDVRPHEADVVLLADLDDLLLERRLAGFAKPDGIRTAPGICFSPHSVSAAATNFAGIANTAVSMTPGTSLTLLYAW